MSVCRRTGRGGSQSTSTVNIRIPSDSEVRTFALHAVSVLSLNLDLTSNFVHCLCVTCFFPFLRDDFDDAIKSVMIIKDQDVQSYGEFCWATNRFRQFSCSSRSACLIHRGKQIIWNVLYNWSHHSRFCHFFFCSVKDFCETWLFFALSKCIFGHTRFHQSI